MIRGVDVAAQAATILLGLAAAACQSGDNQATPGGGVASAVSLAPASMAPIDTVDERYQSYNVEMLEVTGGKFWKSYGPELDSILKQPQPAAAASGDTPAGMNPAVYSYRPPLDLANSRLRKLAAALGPAYVPVSGTWGNTTYFAESNQAPKTPPPGFDGVLIHQQWKGVVDFAKAADAGIVTSFATSPGTRNAAGDWTPREGRTGATIQAGRD